MVNPDHRPSASLSMLRLRAELLHWLRGFFRRHGYWEVETPLLSHDVCVDAWVEPFAVPAGAPTAGAGAGAQTLYLQTSPEFGMKRLIAAGAEAVFQITRAFRKGERGTLHNPEFTMLEWYRTGDTYQQQMDFVEELVRGFCQATREAGSSGEAGGKARDGFRLGHSASRQIERLTYDEAFQQALGCSGLSCPAAELARLARRHELDIPASLPAGDRDGWLNLLLKACVEPMLTARGAVFVSDYPASQAALARIRPDVPPVAERFELYLGGLEICNGYQELTDADELRERFAAQSEKRAAAGLPPLPQHSRLLDAMDAGLPACAGVALGFDRLLMAALGAAGIDDVIAFPFDRA